MSNVTVSSTTDTKEAVDAAKAHLAPKVEVEEKKESKLENKSEENDVEEIDVDDSNDEVSEKDSEIEKPKKKGGFQRKIDKLNNQKAALEQEREYWRTEALKSKAPESKKESKEVESTEGKPDPDKFDSHQEYVEALADWKVEQKLSARDAKQKEIETKSNHQKQIDSHTERVQSFVKDHDDFQELMESVDDVPMSLAVQEIILTSDNGPELMYELAKNKDEYKRICALSPMAAARELGKFEAKISKSEVKEEVKITKAPKPITPVSSKSISGSSKNPDEMSFNEYKVWR
ncbi:MAG: hypothetical protein ABL927_14110, partial [Bdellovibrionales bacterium]